MQVMQMTIGWINLAIVYLLLAEKSNSTTDSDWSERQMNWKKNDKKMLYKLQLCASKGNVTMCGNFTWNYQKTKNSCSELKLVCKTGIVNSPKGNAKMNISPYANSY